MMALQFAQKAVIIDRQRVLLVRKSGDDPHNPGKWELPGGRLKGSEALDVQIVREVREETGFHVTPGAPINMWDWTMSWDGESVRVIAVARFCTLTDAPPGSSQREADDFLQEQRWFPLSEIPLVDVIPSQLPTFRAISSSGK